MTDNSANFELYPSSVQPEQPGYEIPKRGVNLRLVPNPRQTESLTEALNGLAEDGILVDVPDEPVLSMIRRSETKQLGTVDDQQRNKLARHLLSNVTNFEEPIFMNTDGLDIERCSNGAHFKVTICLEKPSDRFIKAVQRETRQAIDELYPDVDFGWPTQRRMRFEIGRLSPEEDHFNLRTEVRGRITPVLPRNIITTAYLNNTPITDHS